MKKNIIHQYFKKKLNELIILVQVDPENYRGLELIVHPDGKVEKTKREFDDLIFDDLKYDGFEPGNALEFNLFLKGLKSF